MARRLSSDLQLQKEKTLKQLRETNIRNISWSRVELVCSGAVFLVALLLYTLTLAPTVTLVDSGELIVAAWGLGVAHPPGFPLWVMLAHLASMLPVGNVAARINFSSAFFGALACAIGTLVVAELQITDSFVAAPRRQNKAAQQSRKIEDSTDRFFIFAPAVGAGLLMTFSRTLWCMLRSPRSILSTRY